MRTFAISTIFGALSLSGLLGCGSSEVAPPAELTADEEATAQAEMQAVEDEEMAQQRQSQGR